MIITREFLKDFEICASACRAALTYDILGMEANDAVAKLIQVGEHVHANDLVALMTTEKWVRANGNNISVAVYRIFNPITGEHIECTTEIEARTKLQEISQAFLLQSGPRVVYAIRNENGDEAWVPSNIQPVITIQ